MKAEAASLSLLLDDLLKFILAHEVDYAKYLIDILKEDYFSNGAARKLIGSSNPLLLDKIGLLIGDVNIALLVNPPLVGQATSDIRKIIEHWNCAVGDAVGSQPDA
ncbi:MAG: hypothetical protein ABJF23_29145 [Bryobacteraceae bacterium]